LYYYGARYYDAELSRFIQPDSIFPDDPTGNSQALNRYTYVYNNPLKFTDPTGNQPRHKKKQDDEVEEQQKIASTADKSSSPKGVDTGATTAKKGSRGVGGADSNGDSSSMYIAKPDIPSIEESVDIKHRVKWRYFNQKDTKTIIDQAIEDVKEGGYF